MRFFLCLNYQIIDVKRCLLISQISDNKSNANGSLANLYVNIFTIFLSYNKTKNYQKYYENSPN